MYGYTYPEIAAAKAVSPDQLSEYVSQVVEQLYGGGSFFSAFRVSKAKATDAAVESLRQGVEKATISPTIHGDAVHIKHAAFTAVPLAKKVAVPAPSNPAATASPLRKPSTLILRAVPILRNLSLKPRIKHDLFQPRCPHPHPDDYVVTPDTYRDWIANVTLEKYALKGSGRICFLLVLLQKFQPIQLTGSPPRSMSAHTPSLQQTPILPAVRTAKIKQIGRLVLAEQCI